MEGLTMQKMRLISAAAGSAFLVAALVGCSEAEDAANDAKDSAKEAGESAMSDAEGKASDALDDATGGDDAAASDAAGEDGGAGESNGSGEGAGGGAGGEGDVTVDLGDFNDDPSAGAVAEFFTARSEAAAAGDISIVEPLVSASHLPNVENWVGAHEGGAGAYTVTIVGVEGETVDACVGADGTTARSLSVADGKVEANRKGQHTC